MPRPEFSQMLTDRRRQLGYSTGQAARALRLKEEVLEAFEQGDFASMPKSGYAQGMLASYARFLGLDAQEVTDLFMEALDDYRAGGSSRRARETRRMSARPEGPVSNQPRVPSRGYLPTSGGIAGDLGDYATTSAARPHGQARAGSYQRRGTGGYGSYGTSGYGGTRSGYSSTLGQSRRAPRRTAGEGRLEEDRYDRGARDAVRRARYDYGRDDITTRYVSPDEYVDDLRYDDTPRPYAPASTRSGRVPMRDLPTPDRPNVQRRPSSRQRQQVRGRGRRSEPQGFLASLTADPLRFIGVVVLLVAIIITVILVFSVRSCGAFRTTSDSDKTVPVSQTTTQDTTSSSGSGSTSSTSGTSSGSSSTGSSTSSKSAEETAAEQQIAAQSGAKSTSGGTEDTATQATVVVSVDSDAVTWLEIECDGESKVAETVNGPWTQSYVVTSSITIQAADTTVVTVTRDGTEVPFESRASGIGSVTIKLASRQSSSATDDASSNAEGSTSNSTSSTDASSSTATTTDATQTK